MENDSVRTSGDATLVDMWIDGKLRAISLSRGAIETYLRLPAERAISEDDRREFVRTNLGLVVAAAKERLRHADPNADTVEIEAGQLGAHGAAQPSARGGERRSGDRRKGDRRKVNLGPPPSGERRRS